MSYRSLLDLQQLEVLEARLAMKRQGSFGHLVVVVVVVVLCIPGSLAATCYTQSRDALLALKNQLVDSSGLLANWKTTTDCCAWTGITCDAAAKVTGVRVEANCRQCGPNGQYLIAKTSISAFGASLGILKTTLKQLALINVQITFKLPIPPVFFTLTNLEYLNLDGCEFSGALPKELGNLLKLTELRINGNKFAGGMPDAIGNLKSLRVLELRANQAPTLGSSKLTLLKKLTRFDYSRNKVTGAIPKWLGALTVPDLNLNSNQFSGSVVVELCNVKGLVSLQLKANKFSGKIPACFGNFVALEYLDVSQNSLSGALPKELGKLKKLTWLFASNNRIAGSLPREIGDLPNLFFIQLQNNKLTGSIPSNWGPSDPIAINPVNFRNNMLTGPIPVGYQNLDESAFRPGNPGLCGPPLSNPC